MESGGLATWRALLAAILTSSPLASSRSLSRPGKNSASEGGTLSTRSARQIVAKSPVAAVATDRGNVIQVANKAAVELFEWQSASFAEGKALFDLVAACDVFGNRLARRAFPFHQVVARGQPVRGFELLVSKAPGKSFRIAVSVAVLFGRDKSADRVVYFLRPVLRRRRADEAIERILAGGLVSVGSGKRAAPSASPLTPRQDEVLRLVADGLSNEEIANALGISVYTVRSHLRDTFRKLSVHSRTQAVKRAFERNIL